MAQTAEADGNAYTLAERLHRACPRPVQQMHSQSVFWPSILTMSRLPRMGGSCIVLGFIGSGTNWGCYMLSGYLGIPVLESWRRFLPSVTPHVLHVHRFVDTPATRQRTLYLHRDGRDAMVSVYFKKQKATGGQGRRVIETAEQRDAFADFLEDYISRPQRSSMHWPEHVRLAMKIGYPRVSYESLKAESFDEIGAALERLTGQPFDRERFARSYDEQRFERIRTAEKARHMRRGGMGEWPQSFNRRARETFARFAGAELIALGYEADDSWVTRTD